jgi:hypothetical protein
MSLLRPSAHNESGLPMAENAFDVGILAEHTRKADWGPGKVVKVRAPYVWVYFRDAPGRAARQFPASLLARASCQSDAVLENLPAFIEKDGLQLLPSERYTLREALEVFHAQAPGGFADAGGSKLQKDRERRRAAHEAYQQSLGGGQAESLLEQGAIAELSRRALGVVTLARALSSTDAAALRDGLQDEAAARAYFTALLAYLAVEPTEPTFAAYASAASGLRRAGAGSAPTWPLVTLLPFLAQPTRHMLVQPTVTGTAAQRLGFDLPWQTTPSWATYEAACRLGRVYLDALGEAGGRDLIDVTFFLAAIVARNGAAAGSTRS